MRQGVEQNLSGCLKEEARRNLRVELMPEGQCPSVHPGRRSFLDPAKHYHRPNVTSQKDRFSLQVIHTYSQGEGFVESFEAIKLVMIVR